MAKITINKDKCKGCLLCISFCPKGAIIAENKLNKRGVKPVKFSRTKVKASSGIPSKAGIKNSECIGCTICAVICPDCCIEVYK